jgi:hypothetical protein
MKCEDCQDIESGDNCPCPVWGCPHRGNCAIGTRTHMKKGHLNACAFYTILPALRQLIEDVNDPQAKKLIEERLVKPNDSAYCLCRKMQTDMPIEEVVEFLGSKVEGLRCNADSALRYRTGLAADYNPLGSDDEIARGTAEWKKKLGIS